MSPQRKRYLIILIISAGLNLPISDSLFSEEEYFLHEDFEGEKVALSHWASDKEGTIEVHELSKEIFHSGKQSEHLKFTSLAPSGHEYWRLPYIEIPLTPGSMMEVSAWVKADAPMDIRLGYEAKGVVNWSGVAPGGRYQGTGEWEEIKAAKVEEKLADYIRNDEVAKKAGYDGSQLLVLRLVGFNLTGFGPENIDLYIDDVKVYSRLPIELAEIEKDKEEVAKLLSAPEGVEFKEKFEKMYQKADLLKRLLSSSDSEERITAQKKAPEIIKNYKELKRELMFSGI